MIRPVQGVARSRRVGLVLATTILLSAFAVVLVCFRHFRSEVVAEAAGDLPFRAAAAHLQSAHDGRPPLLIVDPAAMRSGAIVCRRLEAIHYQPDVPAIGSAIDPVDLAETRDTLVEATDAAKQLAAELQPSPLGTGKQPPLEGDPEAGTEAASQTHPDPAPADLERTRAAADEVSLRRAVALTLYGPGLTGWMLSGNPDLNLFLQARASLLLLTPLPGHPVPLPDDAVITGRRGEAVPARLVSVAYRLDPRFQNIAALYQTSDHPADPHFVLGPAYAARLPVGPVLTGVVAPASAILQRAGKSWVYVEEAPQRYRRREVSLVHALPDGSGWFQDDRLQAGQTVVTTGAALLLGEEQ